MDEPEQIPRACVTCGTWMTVQASSRQVYCSPECSRENLRCQVCGKYFAKGSGFREAESETLCSLECSSDDSRFQHFFKEKA